MTETKNIPSREILNAFGFSGEPVLLSGGEGTCYRVDNAVFKPVRNVFEASWIAEINNSLTGDKFRVPKPFQAKDGSWVYNGWTASEFLEGEHRPGHYAEAIELSKKFHKTLEGITKPSWYDKKTDVFPLSDRMAWGELPLPDFEITNKPLQKIFGLLRPNNLPFQLIHGDWGMGQILFHDTQPPAVLDMTPYFRPADYPIADMLIGAMANDGVDMSILNLGRGIKDFDQLLLRALVFRTCTYVGFQIHPENNQDWTPMINRYLNLIDIVIDKTKRFI